MDDVKRHACGCPDMRSESARDYQGLSPEDAARRWAAEQLAVGGLRSGLGGTAHEQAHGFAQMLRAPGKLFSRETICAIIRAQKTTPQHDEALSALNRLQSIFENLE